MARGIHTAAADVGASCDQNRIVKESIRRPVFLDNHEDVLDLPEESAGPAASEGSGGIVTCESEEGRVKVQLAQPFRPSKRAPPYHNNAKRQKAPRQMDPIRSISQLIPGTKERSIAISI